MPGFDNVNKPPHTPDVFPGDSALPQKTITHTLYSPPHYEQGEDSDSDADINTGEGKITAPNSNNQEELDKILEEALANLDLDDNNPDLSNNDQLIHSFIDDTLDEKQKQRMTVFINSLNHETLSDTEINNKAITFFEKQLTKEQTQKWYAFCHTNGFLNSEAQRNENAMVPPSNNTANLRSFWQVQSALYAKNNEELERSIQYVNTLLSASSSKPYHAVDRDPLTHSDNPGSHHTYSSKTWTDTDSLDEKEKAPIIFAILTAASSSAVLLNPALAILPGIFLVLAITFTTLWAKNRKEIAKNRSNRAKQGIFQNTRTPEASSKTSNKPNAGA